MKNAMKYAMVRNREGLGKAVWSYGPRYMFNILVILFPLQIFSFLAEGKQGACVVIQVKIANSVELLCM